MVNSDAIRGQVLLEESREAVVVLDADGVVVTASRRARQSLGVREGEQLRAELTGRRTGARRPVLDRRSRGAARLSLGSRRSRRLRGASLRLHRVGLARAADAARAPTLAPRACEPSRRGRAGVGRAGTRRDRPDPRADRRGALPGRARVGHARRLARSRARAAGAARGRGGARGAGRASRRRAARRGRSGGERRGPAADDAGRRAQPRRERDPLRRCRLERDPVRATGGRRGRPPRRRRRRRRRPGRAAADLRALLPHRPLARLARHRPRARDREARRRLGGRDGRGARRPGRGLEIRCSFPIRA